MRLGILSDTHGNLENLCQAVRELIETWQVELIIHLGDECEDLAVLSEFNTEVLQVHGVYCEHYQNPDIANRIVKEFDGYRFLLSHTDRKHQNDLPNDPDPEELATNAEVDVILFGHSHIPLIRRENNIIWLNPGHLKNEDKKGYPPSFAVLETHRQGIEMQLIELKTGKIFQQMDTR